MSGPRRRDGSVVGAWLFLASVAMATMAHASGGGERFVFAWPPTRYQSCEIAVFRDAPSPEPLRVRLTGQFTIEDPF